MNDQIQISEAQQNLIAALDYLLHLDRLRSRPVFRLSDHKLPFFHEQAFVGLPGVETNLIEGEEEVWLSIRRLQATPPPAPHDWLRPWVNIPNDPGKKPTILESLVINPEELPPLETLNQAQRQKEGTSTLAVGGEEPTDASLPVTDDLAEIGEAAPEVITVSLEDVPEIRELFEEYVTGSWVSWSKVFRTCS